MGWLEDIQKLPQEKKFRIMWTVAGAVAVILILLWILSVRWQKNISGDKTLFEVIGQGIHNVKENYKK
jgi:hypothetical protein